MRHTRVHAARILGDVERGKWCRKLSKYLLLLAYNSIRLCLLEFCLSILVVRYSNLSEVRLCRIQNTDSDLKGLKAHAPVALCKRATCKRQTSLSKIFAANWSNTEVETTRCYRRQSLVMITYCYEKLANLWRHVRGSARLDVVRVAQCVLKIEKLSLIMGPRGSQDLRSPSLIMAPGQNQIKTDWKPEPEPKA